MNRSRLFTILIPAVFLLASCGGGGDSDDDTTTSAGSAACGDSSVQGSYAGNYVTSFSAGSGSAPIRGTFQWSGSVAGDTFTFQSGIRGAPAVTGTLNGCRFEAAAPTEAFTQVGCGAQDQIQIAVNFGGNRAEGNINGTCLDRTITGTVEANRT